MQTSIENNSESEADKLLKRIKLIMTPLTGILSSKCDISVHSSCLNTWCYLLHKLDTSVNCLSVIKFVWEPIFEVVFQVRADNRNVWLLNFCVELLDNFALARSKDVSDEFDNQVSGSLSAGTPMIGALLSGESSWKHYPIKWLPWDLSQLDFYLKMVYILINNGSVNAVAPEIKSLSSTAAIRIFRSVLRGVQNVLTNSSITYKEVMVCISKMLTFVKKIHEGATENSDSNYLHQTSLQFVEAVTEELGSSTLGSPIYKVPLDLKYIGNLGSVSEFRQGKMLGICFLDHMNMVSPIVYLLVLYLCSVINLTLNVPEAGSIKQGMFKYLSSILSSYDPPEILHAVTDLLYKHSLFECLDVWVAIANCLKAYIDGVKDLSVLKIESDTPGYLILCHFLSHPFASLSCPQTLMSPVKTSGSLESAVSLQSRKKLELEHVIEVWRSLYFSVNSASRLEYSSSKSFSEDLSSMLNGWLDEKISMVDSDTQLDLREKNQDHGLLSLCGEVVICVLEQTMTYEGSCDCEGCTNKENGGCRKFISVNNILESAARYSPTSFY